MHALSSVRAMWWTLRSALAARRQLKRGRRPDAVVLPDPPSLPDNMTRSVRVVTRLLDNTCLERAIVLQKWYAAHGERKSIWIGVSSPSAGFRAHAWLEGETSGNEAFEKLLKVDIQ
jgi:hypothetical protein